jgi:glycosyltransferase involved in cell wall biosynthesis
VDDGSSDETESLFNDNDNQSRILSSCPQREGTFFPIRYFRQENGGKHRAINRGVKEAKGGLFFIADSDDMLPDKALEIVAEQYKEIQNDHSFAGVVGFDAFSDGKMVAGSASFDVLECTEIEFRHKHRIIGDMKEVFRTDVLREIPFPEINGEKFCPEDLVWHRIGKEYKFRYFNQIIYIVEYQPTGLSAKLTKLRMDSPIASLIHYAEYNDFDLPIKQKVRNAINYWRFWYCIPSHKKQNRLIPHLYRAFIWAKPIGWLMHLHDLRVTR